MAEAVRNISTPEGTDLGLAERLGAFLRVQHPHHTAKSVQGRVYAATKEEIGLDAIKKWVSGEKWPSWPSHLDGLLKAYGTAFIQDVMLPSALGAEELAEVILAAKEAALAAERAVLEDARQHRRKFLGGR